MSENAQTNANPRCLACDYNLNGIEGDVCPECGLKIRWDLVNSEFRSRGSARAESVASGLAILIGTGALFLSALQLMSAQENMLVVHKVFHWATLLTVAGHAIAVVSLLPDGLRTPSAPVRVNIMLVIAIMQLVSAVVSLTQPITSGIPFPYRLLALTPGASLLAVVALIGRGMAERETLRDAAVRYSQRLRDKQAKHNL